MIKVNDISKTLGGQSILRHCSLEIRTGEVVVIWGESGAGKSVLLRHLIGLMQPDEGTIEINGVEITRLSEPELLKVRQGIGYLFQESALYDFMTVYDNIAFPLREHTTMSEQDIAQKINAIMGIIDLEGAQEKYPSELSGGMKKRAALGRAIIMDSKTLLCDEPTSGLDPIRSRDISNLIRQVSGRLGCTTVITSHDLGNSLRIADRLLLIHDGGVKFFGTKNELQSCADPFVREFVSDYFHKS